MKTIKTSILLTIAVLFIGINQAVAQSQTLKNVGRNSLRSSGTILEGNIVKGYFFFYFSEKADSKNSIYEVVVYDENLKEIASESIKESKRASLLESSYNGESILFKFYDGKAKEVIYRTMNTKGELSDRVTREANKHELTYYNMSVSQELENTCVNALDKNSFIDVVTYKDKSYKYQINCIDNDGEQKWEYTPADSKGVFTGALLASNNDMFLMLQAESKSVMSRDYTFSLLALENESGEEIFSIPMKSKRYNLMPYNAFFNPKTNNIIIMGQYYNLSDKSMKSESQGIFVKVIDKEGNDVSENFISWKTDIKTELPADKRAELAKYSVYFHDIQLTKDGKIIAIAEQYRKQVSAGGLAAKALSGNGAASATEIKVADMLIVTLNDKYELESATILEKKPSRVNLGAGYGFVNQHVLAKVVDALGYFDYSFTQVNEDNSLISIGYVDIEKSETGKGKELVLNIVSYSSGESEPTKDKVTLKTEADAIRVLPAKPGHVLIMEYSRKKKTIEIRLEPINY